MVNAPVIWLSGEEIWDAYENCVDSETGSWRHGTTETFVFQQHGEYYQATVRFHPEDGLQAYDPIRAVRVVPKTATKTIWVTDE
jgi:hypothetical protein